MLMMLGQSEELVVARRRAGLESDCPKGSGKNKKAKSQS